MLRFALPANRGAGDAAVCIRGRTPERPLSGGFVCRARRERGRCGGLRFRRAPERPLSGEAVCRARRARGGGSQRCCVREALPSAPCPAELFATLDGSAGDAAVCVRGAPPDRPLSAELFAALDGRVASGGLCFGRFKAAGDADIRGECRVLAQRLTAQDVNGSSESA